MFILFGTKHIPSTIKTGAFECPNCRSPKPYTLKRYRKFFTLFFIPVIPLGNIEDTAQCGSCNKEYVPGAVLSEKEYIADQAYTGITSNELNMTLASPVKRLGANIIDILLLIGLNIPLAFLIKVFPEGAKAFFETRFPLLFIPVWILYFALMEYALGATIGKKLFALYTTSENGEAKVSLVRFLIRSIIKTVPILPVVLLFNKNNQAVHDFAAKTIVVEKPW